MPRYDYKCNVCGYVFEAITPSSQITISCVAEQKNPSVLGTKCFGIAQKQLSAPGHIHMGKPWH